ncbi:MAG: fibronectin type III domain-containing protein, partial [Candidatus Latescibacteria bacterium]|nr:fibronectin type III domain-containing protein [Candidatus Latescibacterota bacterium]
GGTRGTLARGFTYLKVDSVTVSLTVTANVSGTARTDTVHTARLPEGLPFITPQKTAPVAALQRLFDALAGLALEIPPGAIDQNITVSLDVRNVTIRNDSTMFAPINGRPSFLFIHPAVSVNGVEQPRFDFSGRAAINLTVLLRKFGRILQASGVDTTAADTLALAYVTPSGLTQEGMISKSRHDDRLIIASLTTLADLAGIRQRDLTVNTAPPAIVSGPFVVPSDTFATVTWRTDKLTTSRVEFGTGQTLAALTQAVTDTQLVNGHVVVLGTLVRQTKYYYRVISEDDRGQRVASRILFFSTVNRPDVRPPTLTVKPQVLAVAPHNAVIGWITDELSTSTVEYGPTAALGTIRTHDALVIRHVLALHGLAQSTTYSALVSSADGSGNVTAYPDTLVFTTPAAPDTLPPRLLSRPVVAGLTPTSAIIQWTTDTPSDSRVTYVAVGTADTLRAVNTEEPLAQQHSVTLTGLTPDTAYLYVVRSTDQEGNPVASRAGRFKTPATADTTPPVIIRGPAVLYASDTVIAIGWVTDEVSDGFVYYKGSGDSTFTSHGVPAQSRRHIVFIGGLTSGETYTFALTSTDPSGNTTVFPPGTVLSKPVAQARPVVISASGGTFTTASEPDVQPPVITGGPRVVARTSTLITISWETDEPGNSQVWYGTNLSQQATDTDLVTAHQVTLTNLSAGTTYPYQVGSTDPAGNGPTWSAQSAATTATTADTEPPVILSGTVRTAVSNDRVTVSWETDEPSDSFVQYGTAPDALTSMVDEADLVTSHTVVLTNLSPNQAYSIRATSTDLAGNGPTATTALSVTTTATADTARPVVSGVQANAVATTDTSVTLTVAWQTDRLATSVVEYGTTSSLGSSVTNTTTGTVHQTVIPRLLLGTRYFFRAGSASATDPQGSRLAYSTTSSLTTPASVDTTTPAAPAAVTAIPGDGAAYLRWTPSPSASVTGYTILRNGNALATVGRDSTFLDVSATNGQAQSYTIRAISAIGKTSPLSASASATPHSNQVPTAPASSSPASGDTVSLAPVLVIGNSSPVTGDPARAALTYRFQVGADSAFSTLVASVVGVAQGVSGNPTHWKVEDTGLPGVSLLQSGERYWWRGRANDGIFNGAWSTPRTFVASASKPTGITPGHLSVTRQFALRQNVPNPFNPATAIRYDLPRAAQVTLRVYNLLGQEVAVLVDARQEPGYYTVRWDGRNRAGVSVASGLYFYRLRAGEFTRTKKMMLVR